MLGDLQGALKAFEQFITECPDDSGEIFNDLSFALAIFRSGDHILAKNLLKKAMLTNLYILPTLVGVKHSDITVPAGSHEFVLDIDAIKYASPFFKMWSDDEVDWAKTCYESEEFKKFRKRYVEIRELLNNEPLGPRRTMLVSEMYCMYQVEGLSASGDEVEDGGDDKSNIISFPIRSKTEI